jgi:hypothetical protein
MDGRRCGTHDAMTDLRPIGETAIEDTTRVQGARMGTYNPAFILHRPGIQPTVVSDFLPAKLTIEDRPNLVEVTHKALYTLDQVEPFFERIRPIRDVAVDLETTGLSWENDVIRCIGVNYGLGNADSAVIAVGTFRQDGTKAALKPRVKDWLESGRHRFIGQNRKFDTHALRQWCGVEERKMDWDDTIIMAYLFDEDTTNGLKTPEALAPSTTPWRRITRKSSWATGRS